MGSSSLATPPTRFVTYNGMLSKQLVVVVDIDGLDLLSSATVGRYVRYGDPYNYGDASLYYGTLVPLGQIPGDRNHRVLIDQQNSLTISQRLEPEQGRGSISALSINFVDKDGYVTKAVSSGPIVPEILGRQTRIWVGYAQTSWPDDYYVVWRGRVGQVNASGGSTVGIQFVDPNVVRRQQIFFSKQTTLSADIDAVTTTISVDDNSGFFEKITGPDGTYDQNVRCFMKIGDEFIEYQPTGYEASSFGSNVFTNCVRGVSPTGINSSPAATHSAGDTIDAYIYLSGHAMDIALKLMLSGWGGDFLTGQSIASLNQTDDSTNPNISNGIILPQNVDAVRDLGVTVGDTFTITGDGVSGNNLTGKVTGFTSVFGQNNRVILTDKTFTVSDPSTGSLAVRSQYDVWPDLTGCRIPGWEVDVGTFQFYKNTYLSSSGNEYGFLINGAEAGKTFIENQILLPLGAYSLTRQGKISMGLTVPNVASDRTQIVKLSNVIQPNSINVQRGVNNRKFFNEIQWSYDYDDAGNASNNRYTFDSSSLNDIGILQTLPIDAKGARTSLNFALIVANRETALLDRYKRGAVLIDIKVNLTVGALIEAGDIVLLQDNGQLQIANFLTGARNMGAQLMEVINRSLDLKNGVCQLQLEGGVLAQTTDRYGTVTPSSLLTSDSNATRLVITESYGNPSQENLKWGSYIGLLVRVHSDDYTFDETVTFTGFDPLDDHALYVTPALSSIPPAGYILDVAQYPDDTSALNQQIAKLIGCYLDPSIAITSGVSSKSFNVASGDASRFMVGYPIKVQNPDCSSLSPETTVASVSGTLITVTDDLGFTPDSTMTAQLLGFKDGGQPYRLT